MLRSWLTAIGASTSHPLAFLVVGVYVALWLIFDAGSFDWHSIATVATWIMTLFIQRAETRDTQAIRANKKMAFNLWRDFHFGVNHNVYVALA
jgi:low affinity Fe/Cu permease